MGSRAVGVVNPLYEPLDFVVVRVPLLPLATFDALTDDDLRSALTPAARVAIAVGSLTFDDALHADGLDRERPAAGRDSRVSRALRRYLSRMSTRPTPFGLFAGVGLGGWGAQTDLTLATGRRPQRTRPDSSWLLTIVDRAESMPEIRRELQVVANRAAYLRAGRIVLAERVSRDDSAVPPAVSVRATGVVSRALAAARSPIRYADLADLLCSETPGATTGQVEGLLSELCRQSLLLSTLRPPLTVPDPAGHVLEQLATIRAAAELHTGLQSVLAAVADFDAAEPADVTEPAAPLEQRFRAVVSRAAQIAPGVGSPLQVDAGLNLIGRNVSSLVAAEAARAAELLLRMSPTPRGPAHLDSYRRSFEQRYGLRREVPLLELLDPNIGLGPPAGASSRSDPRPKVAERNRALLALASTALRDRTRCIDLDDATLNRLDTDDLPVARAPLSLDLTVVVAAASREAVDAGDFELGIGPSVGGMAAGRMLGRFADFVPGATDALQQIAAVEASRLPGRLPVELSYAPRSPQLSNVSTRPMVRPYEIAVGVTSGSDPDHTIGVDELVVGIRDGRLVVRWAATGQELVITAGHMLSYARAPLVAKFLSEVGRDGGCQLAGFQWGPAATFPFLPRVRSGRLVLSLAQWQVGAADFAMDSLVDLDRFRYALDQWRKLCDAPPRLAIAAGDHRLALDLTRAGDADELRRTLRRESQLVLTEVFPDTDSRWLADTTGRPFTAELVVPLVRRQPSPEPPPAARTSTLVDARPPGSDWLFAKLYTGRDLENDLLAGALQQCVRAAAALGFTEWFFLRYTDSGGRHIRLRFRGASSRLLSNLLPLVSSWATDLMDRGELQRFSFDTYERELDRFGGPAGTTVAEELFFAESAAVADLLLLRSAGEVELDQFAAAVLTVDALLAGLGLSASARAAWCTSHAGSRAESGADYRTWKALLRPLLAGSAATLEGTAVGTALDRLQLAGASAAARFTELASSGELSCSPSDIHASLLHLHLNRLLAADHATERRVYGVLGRLRTGLLVAASS